MEWNFEVGPAAADSTAAGWKPRGVAAGREMWQGPRPMHTQLSRRLLSAATVAVFAFSCAQPVTPAADGGTVVDGGAGGGTGGGAGGGTGGGAGGGTGGGTGGGAGGGTGGGMGGGTGGGPGTVGAACQLEGPDTCAQGESCILVEMGANQFEPHCMLGGCDLVAQNCAGGQACGYSVVNGVVQRACVAPGTRQKGESCGQSAGNCAAGLVCAGGATGGATCRQFCEKQSDCGAGASCAFLITIQGTQERPLTCEAVADSCDVLLQNCPTATDGCYLSSIGNKCLPAGTAAVGQPCDSTTLCEKGASCISVAAGPNPTLECVRLCGFPNTAPACPAGTCQQLSTQSGPVADGGVGACR